MSTKSVGKPVQSDVLHRTIFQVKCDHPKGRWEWEYGVNAFLFEGPTAEADARIRAAELTTAGRTNVAIKKQEHRKVRLAGQRVDRDRFVWTEVS